MRASPQYCAPCAASPWLASLLVATPSLAQNPMWPPPPGVTPAELRSPTHWPDDPDWGYAVGGAEQCLPGGGRCWRNETGGMWNYWSWTPPETLPRLRADEHDDGAGVWTDMAWQFGTGDPRVLIAVLDSGIRWDERDLIEQYFVNRGELDVEGLDPRCRPQPPSGHSGDRFDLDGDGTLSMRDWWAGRDRDAREAIARALDEGGNRNGVGEPGDLIRLCSNGRDDDGNGYTDDISGWDFFMEDNDPYDDTRFGHGTGEARDSAAAGNNGIGGIGQCPGCRLLMVRVADSFVADAQDFAQGVIFAVDSGASVVQEALGTYNNTTYMRRALDYAYARGALVVASAADENSRHHNMPGTANHTLYVHAVRFAGPSPQSARSYLAFNTCTNYGAQLVLSAPGTGCSSEATGVTSGVAGLVYAQGLSRTRPGGPLDPPLSAEEVRQILLMTATDIHVPESQPSHPAHERIWYPSRPGWDQRFGYGRLNAYAAVRAVREGRIPPEVDLISPDWFRVLDPTRTPTVVLRGRIAARRAPSFDWVIEWAPGIEPDDEAFRTIASGTGATAPLEGELARWDISSLRIDNPAEAENRHTVTVRVRAVARYGGAIGEVRGETRRAFAIVQDPDLLPGFPVALGVRHPSDPYPAASGEAPPRFYDVDGDGRDELFYADTDGLLHAFRADGSQLAGYPVRLGRLRGLDPADPRNHLRARAYASGAVPADDVGPSVVGATPAIADLDRDGTLEVVVPTIEGDLYVLGARDGTVRPGFPVGLPEVRSEDTSREHVVERGIFAPAVLEDLDRNGDLEIIVAGWDGHVHVFDHDGSVHPGFPVRLVAPELWREGRTPMPGRSMTAPAVGDADGDGIPDIAVGTSEVGDDRNAGPVFLVHGDGHRHPGGPIHANWPLRITSLDVLPLVGIGVTSPMAMANVDDDPEVEIAVAGTAAPLFLVDGRQPPRARGEDVRPLLVFDSGSRGPLSDITDPVDRPLLNAFAAGGFGDVDGDGRPEYLTGGAGLRLAAVFAGGWENAPFSHQVGAWRTDTGKMIA
ncbi:MAG: S8 family serine peptidase, partial [Myxococcota bacterium]|nr:S8 family serine peptidase [Myxococcota bacterium]